MVLRQHSCLYKSPENYIFTKPNFILKIPFLRQRGPKSISCFWDYIFSRSSYKKFQERFQKCLLNIVLSGINILSTQNKCFPSTPYFFHSNLVFWAGQLVISLFPIFEHQEPPVLAHQTLNQVCWHCLPSGSIIFNEGLPKLHFLDQSARKNPVDMNLFTLWLCPMLPQIGCPILPQTSFLSSHIFVRQFFATC